MNSTGMGRVLMKAGVEGPAMEEINRMIANGESSNKTIFTVVKKKETLDKAIDIVKSFCGAARPSRWATTRGLIRKTLKLTWSKYKDQEV